MKGSTGAAGDPAMVVDSSIGEANTDGESKWSLRSTEGERTRGDVVEVELSLVESVSHDSLAVANPNPSVRNPLLNLSSSRGEGGDIVDAEWL